MSVIERERVEAPQVEREVTKADVLRRAADLLEEQGWCQGSYGLPFNAWYAGERPMQPLCFLGAVVQSARDYGVETGNDFYQWARNYAGESYGFNDHPGRTKNEVVARLREAARRAE
jgi:hypothetical protein